MSKNNLHELFILTQQQMDLQEKLTQRLLKTEQLLAFSENEIKRKLQNMPQLLAHLSVEKQEELKVITTLICQHIEVDMVILFGSYARNDWVEEKEEDEIHYKYQSDYDLLVIVSETCKISEQRKLEQTVFKAINELKTLHTPVSIIVHDINFINSQLNKAQYFFSDILKEGVKLYDSDKFVLITPPKLAYAERYQLAKEDFEYWFGSVDRLFENFSFNFQKAYYRDAAFLLHQITERLYSGILLVYTRYKPKTHKLETLRKLTTPLDKCLIKVFPLTSPEEIDRFTLLCEAYIDARYNKNYRITASELTYLMERVQELKHLAGKLCQEKIAHFLEQATKHCNSQNNTE